MKHSKIYEICAILIGNLLLAISVAYFVLPYDILSGGVAGIAVITKALFQWPETIVIDVLVVGLFVMGAVIFGKEFALKTALSSVAYPVFLNILVEVFPYDLGINELFACIFGGIIAGAGMGIVFKHGASTGGTDIPALAVHKYTGIDVDKVILFNDCLCTIAGLFTFGIEHVLYGIIYIYTSSYAIGKTMVPNGGGAVALYIISNEKEKICDYIHVELFRGSTILKATGGYTQEERDVILTVVSKREYAKLSEYVAEVDPYAFIIVSDAKDIKGEGFTYEYRV